MTKRKRKRRRGTAATPDDGRRDQLALWTLRAMLRVEGRRMASLLTNDCVLEAAGVPSAVIESQEAPSSREEALAARAELHKSLEERLKDLERTGVDRDDALFDNVDLLGEAIGLEPSERELLAFVVLAERDRGLSECFERLPKAMNRHLARDLSRVLDVPSARVRSTISDRGILLSTGLLKTKRYSTDSPLEVLEGLDDLLLSDHVAEDDLLSFFFRPGRRSTLAATDFPHVEREVFLLSSYLSSAVEERVAGANVLLHGPPGTGKTELARLLAESVDVPLFEVNVEDREGDGLGGSQRLSSYLTSQRILGRRGRALILFDEVEDVFPRMESRHFLSFAADDEKGRVNKVLETNPVPAIWVSNAIRQMDRAFLRRFDFVLEVPVPPRDVRRRIVERRLSGLAGDGQWVETIAANEHVTPADVDRAARVTRMVTRRSGHRAPETAERVIVSALEARGQQLHRVSARKDAYDLGLANTNVDLARLLDNLGRQPQGSICLHGPPGTGKTAFARYLAERLGLELVQKRASDLLSKWVGESEANLARMFRGARPGRDLLLLDEADSFFRERRSARASWEVTQVNELLVQMESYEGLFVCSTNLIDGFDQAAFRRFALKIRFDFLRADQRWRMLELTAERLGIELDASDLRRRLDQLTRLTPGDFAAVRRRFRLVGIGATAADLVDALAEELSFKPEGKARRVGFGERA